MVTFSPQLSATFHKVTAVRPTQWFTELNNSNKNSNFAISISEGERLLNFTRNVIGEGYNGQHIVLEKDVFFSLPVLGKVKVK